jgi:hypothetical protein
VKIHTISNKPREGLIMQILPNFLFIYLFKTNKTCNMEMTSYAKVRSHL